LRSGNPFVSRSSVSQGVVNDCNDRAALGQGKRQLKNILMEWGLVGLLVKNFMVKVTQDNEHT